MEFCRSSSCTAILMVLLTAACASRPNLTPKGATDDKTPITAPADNKEADEAKANDLSEREQIQKLREKIVDLETRISALNEKINIENGVTPTTSATTSKSKEAVAEANEKLDKELPVVDVKIPAATAKVVPTSKTPVKFVQDENVDRYREAKILYDSNRYSDATVEFVAFTKDAPDHALAPAAQYFVGMGYLKQKEYARAEEELSRGLVSYPHSNYVPDTLLALLEVSVALKKPGRVTYYQQKLIGTFPDSPQALKAALTSTKSDSEGSHPEKRETPVARPEAPTAPEAPSAPKSTDSEAEST